MKKVIFKKQFQSEKGMTLIEVVASIVILSIILLSVYKLLISSSETTKTSETIIDATYIAQTEMENFYSFSHENNMPAQFDKEIFPSYEYKRNEDSSTFIYQNDTDYPGYSLELKLKLTGSNMTRIILKVYNNKNVLKSQMETTLEWGNS